MTERIKREASGPDKWRFVAEAGHWMEATLYLGDRMIPARAVAVKLKAGGLTEMLVELDSVECDVEADNDDVIIRCKAPGGEYTIKNPKGVVFRQGLALGVDIPDH